MHDTNERLSVLWIFALLNYLYADVVALFDIAGSRSPFEPLPQWALMGSAVLMEIPIAMILAVILSARGLWGICHGGPTCSANKVPVREALRVGIYQVQSAIVVR
jgi:hypothetical protein